MRRPRGMIEAGMVLLGAVLLAGEKSLTTRGRQVAAAFLGASLVLGVLMAAAWAVGNSPPRPVAPPLIQGEPVYENKQEGFRFLPPPNWPMHSRTEVPPGKLDKERLLVSYKRATGGGFSILDVSMNDVPPGKELKDCVAEYAVIRKIWEPDGKPRPFEVAGLPALRQAFKSSGSANPLAKEVVGVLKGERVYFFAGIFAAKDTKSRDQVRKAVESLTW